MIVPASIPTAATAAAMLILGIVTVIHERGSRVSLALLGIVVTVSHWLFCLAVIYSAPSETTASFFAHVAYLGIPFIAPAVYTFSAVLLRVERKVRARIALVWILSAALAVILSGSDVMLSGVHRYAWGYYPRLEPASIIFVAFFFAVLAGAVRMFVTALRVPQAELQRKRTVAFVRALGIGYIAGVDFLPSFGIGTYPVGFFAVTAFIAMAALAAWRYHLVDLTPQFAANEILSTMHGAVLVTDADQNIRLANRAAVDLLGRTEEGLIGRPLEAIVEKGEHGLPNETIIRGHTVRDRLMTWVSAFGRRIEVAVSGTPLRDTDGSIVGSVYVALDITQIREAEREIERLSRYNQLILDSAGEGIYGVDAAGRTTFVNPSAQRMLGWSADELHGEARHQRIHHTRPDGEKYPASECPIERAIETGTATTVNDDVFWRRDGSSFPVEYIATPIFEAGKIAGAVITFNDVTERKISEEQRNEVIRQQEALRVRDEVMANVSHDLRSPVTAILGWSQILQQNFEDRETLRIGLSAIQQSALIQRHLVDDLMDASRIASGTLHLQRQPLDLCTVTTSTTETLQPLAAQRRQVLHVRLAEKAVVVDGDESRIRQIIWNLLSNAIKFTEDGGNIIVTVQRDSEGRLGEVSVADDGCGISPDFLPYVFDRHKQETRGKEGKGLGLGLAIVKQLVELHGGTVKATSAGVGQGARFSFTIPLSRG